MYYYGYQGGYGYNSPCCGGYQYPYGGYSNNGGGYGAAIILVLFILLVIVIGARWLGNN
ncbi:MAG TPA: sporulation protein YjcZ [Candidatus Aphodocola excrementigallinarum]|uniref:Sporulation protein YjcZ n=1 Tax=Candidatus Aphodocola excrementigallinarum TaxID=2840670 RepID=A0A9D1INK3_9FIRM|nr:sporulation protein YjcZ [Candidatus Aphodocola excrementigallinarum]